MKKSIFICILIYCSCLIKAEVHNSLPGEPWDALVFSSEKQKSYLKKWEEGTILVKLYGNYIAEDSLMLSEAIKKANGLCETIRLELTAQERGNLEIYFIDSLNKDSHKNIVRIERSADNNYTYNYRYDEIYHCNLIIQKSNLPDNSIEHFLPNFLFYGLYPNRINLDYYFKRGRELPNKPSSIFSGWYSDELRPIYKEFSDFDKALIKAVYSLDYEHNLQKAKKEIQFYPDWIQEKNMAKKIMIFPFALILFLFTWILIKVYQHISSKVKNKLLLFNIISAMALLVLGIVAIAYTVITEKLEDPYLTFYAPIDLIAIVFILLIVGLPAVNLFRVIEKGVNRLSSNNYFRVVFYFLSTTIIPTLAVYFFILLSINGDHLHVVTISLVIFTFIGIIRALVSFFIQKEKQIQVENGLKLAHLRELKTKAELNALHSKINPHFLYNALNSIAGLAKINADKAEQMALSLSKLFRYSINKEQSDWSTLGDEVEMVQIYLNIEKVRFDERLDFHVDLPDELKTEKVPRFIIQPLVENAVKHGVSKLMDNGKIALLFRKAKNTLEITVADNGPDFPKELEPGFGLQSIYDKLEMMYPDKFEMHFMNMPEKKIILKLS